MKLQLQIDPEVLYRRETKGELIIVAERVGSSCHRKSMEVCAWV